MRPRDYMAVKAAGRIFKLLGVALADLQIYTRDHPRFQETLTRAARLVEDYFEKQPKSVHLTYTLRRGQAEFRRIPLVDTDSHGERVVRILTESAVAGLQLRRNISADEIHFALDLLVRRSRAKKASSGSPPVTLPTTDEDAKLQKFRLITEGEARRMEAGDYGTGGDDEDFDESSSIPEFLVSQTSLRSMLDTYSTLMATLEKGGSLDLDVIKSATDQAVSLLAATDQFALPSLTTGYFDDFTFHHSVNVCMIATKVASSVFEGEDLNRISLAALLHDVGKCRIPPDILHKPSRLTDAEFQCMQGHPVFGADILLGVQEIDSLCVSVAFSHHMHDKVGSYPSTRAPFHFDWVTDLISTVDIYEALTAARPYKKGLTPEKAFDIMVSMPGLQKRPPIVKMLYNCVGPYPVGTIVALNTGERAMVLEHNHAAPRFPKIRLLTDDQGNVLSDAVERDLSEGSPAATRIISRGVVCQTADDNPLTVELEPEPTDILGQSLENDVALMAQEG